MGVVTDIPGTQAAGIGRAVALARRSRSAWCRPPAVCLSVMLWLACMRRSRKFSPRYTTELEMVVTVHVHILYRPCDSFNQLAKKLVTRLVASLERAPGKRHLAQNYLPLWSKTGQPGVPIVLLSLPSDRH